MNIVLTNEARDIPISWVPIKYMKETEYLLLCLHNERAERI